MKNISGMLFNYEILLLFMIIMFMVLLIMY